VPNRSTRRSGTTHRKRQTNIRDAKAGDAKEGKLARICRRSRECRRSLHARIVDHANEFGESITNLIAH
jgi:hypothetical protein